MSARERVAAAPISWGVCEVPGWGYQVKRERVLGDVRDLGLFAIEAGPDGFLPTVAGELRALLDRYGLRLVGGFLPLVLHDDPALWRGQVDTVARRLAAAGGEVLVLAAVTGLVGYDVRPELDDGEWRRLCTAADMATGLAADHGLRAVLHPHVGTVVERPYEIARVLGGSSIPLCVDTGHIMAGGGDPVALARQAVDRVGHVHVKDVRAGPARMVADGRLAYSDAVRDGLCCPLGDGDVDVAGLVGVLADAGYDGWYVLEQDIVLDAEPPLDGCPRRDVGRSAAYLDALLSDVRPRTLAATSRGGWSCPCWWGPPDGSTETGVACSTRRACRSGCGSRPTPRPSRRSRSTTPSTASRGTRRSRAGGSAPRRGSRWPSRRAAT